MNNDIKSQQQNYSLSSCLCHPPSPYKTQDSWSLQKVLIYAWQLFIDKRSTKSHWSASLTSTSLSLSYSRQKKMIQYASYDVMAVTYLIRPITEHWFFKRIKDTSINELFIAFQSMKLPSLPTPLQKKRKIKNINVQKLAKMFDQDYPDLEPISSDEEIYLNQLIGPVKDDGKFYENNGRCKLSWFTPKTTAEYGRRRDGVQQIEIALDQIVQQSSPTIYSIA